MNNIERAKKQLNIVLILLGSFMVSSPLFAGEVSIAVAANFTNATRTLAALFEKTSGHKTRISYGSTGKLFSQIENGAPFEVFLAADTQRPMKAETDGLAVPASRFIYAKGRLVLWSAEKQRFTDGESYIKKPEFRHIAIANPKTAPYGLAARQVLKHLGLWQALQGKLVRGDSIAQTFQFVATSNAEAGFVSSSQVKAWKNSGSTWEIPENYYAPINQAAVLLKKGKDNPAALAFLDFLKSDMARETISNYGYGVDINTKVAGKEASTQTIGTKETLNVSSSFSTSLNNDDL